jgi:mono/diheme cytochrome c family protein
MRKFMQILAYVVAGLVAVVAVAVVMVYWKSGSLLKKTHVVPPSAEVIPADAAAIARGKHLAETRGCVDCHGKDLGGAKVIDDPAMGRLYGPNITRGPGGLATDYADQDFVRAIRHGVAQDGRGLFLMPSTDFAHFSESDMGDLIAYVKSVAPVDRESVPLKVGPVARALLVAGKIKIAANEIDHVTLKPEVVTPGVTVAYGRYVAISCTGCHGNNFSGGKIEIGPPDWPPAANLTPHVSGHVGKWTEKDFLAVIRTGTRPDGSSVSLVMPRAFGQMNDTELKAIWAYLQTLSPLQTGTR